MKIYLHFALYFAALASNHRFAFAETCEHLLAQSYLRREDWAVGSDGCTSVFERIGWFGFLTAGADSFRRKVLAHF